jgi:hypothetical protein
MRQTGTGTLLKFRLTWSLLLVGIGSTAQAATVTVVNANDSGPGSLRQAIVDAAPGDTIDFAVDGCPCTIALTSGELDIDKNLTIHGPGADRLAVSGQSTTRVFRIRPTVMAEISGLGVRDGRAVNGAGIWVQQAAALTLIRAVVSGEHRGAQRRRRLRRRLHRRPSRAHAHRDRQRVLGQSQRVRWRHPQRERTVDGQRQ